MPARLVAGHKKATPLSFNGFYKSKVANYTRITDEQQKRIDEQRLLNYKTTVSSHFVDF
ncbi:hypothetical protein [Mucilaginibacter sp. OK283]|jgi:hypothetical protein|uniref:hypothetical protein n=1 Tax=Mucilaginibacter sp. OK283 TaxID=1881049 RepID=UPI0015A66B78|nr:hypothetical protein [Mucilaginibacter sp. OK283]